MRIRMLQRRKYAFRGIDVKVFEVGSTQELPKEHALGFIKNGWAEEDKAGPQPEEVLEANHAARKKAEYDRIVGAAEKKAKEIIDAAEKKAKAAEARKKKAEEKKKANAAKK